MSSFRFCCFVTFGFCFWFATIVGAGNCFAQTESPAELEGFKPIFNGKDLSGWSGDSNFWRVEEGAIVGETIEVASKGFLPWTTGTRWRR